MAKREDGVKLDSFRAEGGVFVDSSSSGSSGSSGSSPSAGSSCSNVFPSGASTSASTASVNIGYLANIVDSPGDVITTQNLTEVTPPSCGADSCSESGTLSSPIYYSTFPGGTDVVVNYAATYNFTPGDYGSLTTSTYTTLTFEPGTYTFNGDVNIGSSSNVSVSGAGAVLIYVNGDFGLGSSLVFNTSATSSQNIFVYSTGNMVFSSYANAQLTAYAEGSICRWRQCQYLF